MAMWNDGMSFFTTGDKSICLRIREKSALSCPLPAVGSFIGGLKPSESFFKGIGTFSLLLSLSSGFLKNIGSLLGANCNGWFINCFPLAAS